MFLLLLTEADYAAQGQALITAAPQEWPSYRCLGLAPNIEVSSIEQ